MKKFLSVILAVFLVMSLLACSTSNAGKGNAEPGEDNRYRVGYGRADITPDYPVGLSGYGNTSERISKTVLDRIYLTCVAITDAEDNTIMLVTIDLGAVAESSANSVRGKINKETGIPKENITVSATHSHSVPDFGAIGNDILKAAKEAAVAAMEDRTYADMYYGQTMTKGLNFVRSYEMENGTIAGASFGSFSGPIKKHVSDADEQMQLIQFKRDNDKADVILVNWQAHNHLTGGADAYDLSADWVGTFRMNMENDLNCLFAYYQGAAGNLNPYSMITEENAVQPEPRNYVQHGKLLAGHAKEALASMEPVEPAEIQVRTENFVGECFHESGEVLMHASDVVAYYDLGHSISETKVYAEQFGIHSYYHAKAISGRSGNGATKEIPITTITMGNIGFATIPGELFDVCGQYIKENSPMDMTFVMGYCNGAVGYLPSEYAFTYGSYEVDISAFVKGTAEAVASRQVEILTEMSVK